MTEDKSQTAKKGVFVTLREKKYELLFNFIVMIIGILAGFQIEGIIKQISLNNDTRTKLHIMYLESEYNIIKGNHIYDICRDTNSFKISFKKLDDIAARAVTNDENIFNILQPHGFSLILSYIDAVQTLNTTYEKYISYLESIGYVKNLKSEALKKVVKENSIGFLATCFVLQQNFKSYMDKNEYDKNKIKKNELEIQKAKEAILIKGNLKIEK